MRTVSNATLITRLSHSASAERLCLSVCLRFGFLRGYASDSARRSLAETSLRVQTERQSLSALWSGGAALYVLFLLLTAHWSLLTIRAQPGMPQPNSPLYGARPQPGQVSTGLPNALKKVG